MELEFYGRWAGLFIFFAFYDWVADAKWTRYACALHRWQYVCVAVCMSARWQHACSAYSHHFLFFYFQIINIFCCVWETKHRIAAEAREQRNVKPECVRVCGMVSHNTGAHVAPSATEEVFDVQYAQLLFMFAK